MSEEDPARREQYWRDSEFLETHLDELATRYPNQWVAVFNQEVVAVADDFQGILAELQARGVEENRAVLGDLAPPGSRGHPPR